MLCPRSFALSLVTLAACNGSGAPGPDSDASTAATTDATTTDNPVATTSSTGGEAPPTTEATTESAAGPTYYRDIKQIIDNKCATCHQPGDVGPFSLTNYEEVSTFAPIFRAAVAEGTMPPWPPGADCNSFVDPRSLTTEEQALVLEWIDAGAPEGDPADAPPPTMPKPPIDYDVEIGLAEPFTPATDVPDDYRCFLLDWPKDQPTYATAFTVEPGAREIVHHVIAFIIPPGEVATYEALDAADPGPGYTCYGGPGGEALPQAEWLGAWVPGQSDGALPEDTGILVQPGSKIALQMHYHANGIPMADQSAIKVRTAESVARPAYLLPFTNPGWLFNSPPMTIPAGAKDVEHSFAIDLSTVIGFLHGGGHGVGVPLLAHMAGVHMHTRGARATATVVRGGSTQACLVDVPRWDFNWQGIYEFAEPILIEPSDLVRIECHFDNSSGDTPLKWGEGTDDEMCLGAVYVSAPAR
jgi:hypothetical protein